MYNKIKKRLIRIKKGVYATIPRSTKANETTPIQIKHIRDLDRSLSYLMAAFNHGLKADNNYQQDVWFCLQMNPASITSKQSAAKKPGTNWLKLDQPLSLLGEFPIAPKVGRNVSQLLNLCVYAGVQRPYELVSSRWKVVNWEEKPY